MRYLLYLPVVAVCAAIVAAGAWRYSEIGKAGAMLRSDMSAIDRQPVIHSRVVADADLHDILPVLHSLRSLPGGFSERDRELPFPASVAASARLRDAAVSAYGRGLEALLRSRLIVRMEQLIEANVDDPVVVYEALKVYMMLGSHAPKTNNELIVAWMRADWEQNLYPGAANRAGRDEMEAHLRAMLELGRNRAPGFELDGSLIETAQRRLARMNVADRAYALVRSAVYSSPVEDFSVAAKAGPDSDLVFETVDGSRLESLAVPGLYTYAGFHDYFLALVGDIAAELADEQWLLGEFGQVAGINEQLSRLGPALIDRYAADFAREWNGVLDNLALRSMTADSPQYVSLSAASSPRSPLRLLVEAMTRETMLTRAPQPGELGFMDPAAGGDADRMRNGVGWAQRESRAMAEQAMAAIERQFQPFYLLVEGDAGHRPIDALVQNFYDIYQNLVLAAVTPSQAERASANLELHLVNLRADASRLPRVLSRMIGAAVEDFEGAAADTAIAQLNRMLASTVTRACEEVILNRYPFERRSDRDVPMAGFARLFAPDGIIDGFFARHLEPLVDKSGERWEWRQDMRLGRELSRTSLREFQRASQIRDAFFPQGGATPNVTMTIGQRALHADVDMALLDINGQVVATQHAGSAPATVQWPGSAGSGGVAVTLIPELQGRPSSLEFKGPWAVMRLLEAGSLNRSGEDFQARFDIGGRDAAYDIRLGAAANPFFLPALSEFSCPAGL